MQKSRVPVIVLPLCLAVFALSARAEDGRAWADLMARMWRAFAAMVAQSATPRSTIPDRDNSALLGLSSNFRDWPPGAWSSPRDTPWRSPFATGSHPWAPAPPNPTSQLDGRWETHSGALLLVHAGRARLYLDQQTYQDFDLRLDEQVIVLRDRRYGSLRRYAYASREGRLVMQDADGNLLLLRRVPAPRLGR